MKFTIKALELWSESEGKVVLRAENSSFATIYVPLEELPKYKLGQEFVLLSGMVEAA